MQGHPQKHRTSSLIFYLSIILPLIAGIFVGTAFATQDWPNPPFSSPNQDKTLINVVSPSQNQTCLSNNISVDFTVTKPQSWISGPTYTWITPGYFCWGQITTISYYLDGIQSNKTVANDPIEAGLRVYDEPPSRELSFSINLTGLSDGAHNLIVNAEGESLYHEGPDQTWLSNKVVGNSSEIVFIIDTGPPIISLTSPENKVYNTSQISLLFATNEPSQITYSLDGLGNVTYSGNSTLTGLSTGLHTITVFATDVAGNIESKTISFTVTKPPASLPIMPIAASCIVVVGVALLVYFKKRKN